MQTHTQQTLNPARPICRVRFNHTQPGYGRIAPFDMFDILDLSAPSDRLAIHSTVTLRTIVAAGFEPVHIAREMEVA